MEDRPRNISRTEEERQSPDDRDVMVEGPLVSMPVTIEEPVGTPEYDTSHPVRYGNGQRDKLKLGKKRRFGEAIVRPVAS